MKPHDGPRPPSLRADRCIRCGRCADVCVAMVWRSPSPLPQATAPARCIGCGHCAAACPADALDVGDAPAGQDASPDGLEGESRILPLIRSRRSIRCYRPDPVPGRLLEPMLEAARHSPTGSNRQCVRHVILVSPGTIADLRGHVIAFFDRASRVAGLPLARRLGRTALGGPCMDYLGSLEPIGREARLRWTRGEDRYLYRAPVVWVVHAEAWDPSAAFDCAVALHAAALVAHDLGLGTCFNGLVVQSARHDGATRRFLGIPESDVCYGAMTVGWPAIQYHRVPPRRSPDVTWR